MRLPAMLASISVATRWDDEAEAQRFLATPHPELARRKPIEAALTELGARQVEDIVMRALYGLPA